MAIDNNNFARVNIPKSVFFATLGAFFLALMAFFAKLASESISEPIIVFARFAVTGFYILLMLQLKHWHGQHVSLKTKHFGMHMLRATTSTASMYSLYYALRYIPLVDANLLFLTYPLFALLLTAFFFKEKTRMLSWTAMMIGFVGIILVLKPGCGVFHPAALIALLSGIFAAASILGIHKLSQFEHPYTIMFYYTTMALIVSASLMFFGWHTPTGKVWWWLLGVGVAGALYQEFLTRALSWAPARIPSSLMYLSVIFSSIFGLLIWNQMPNYLSWVGIALVCLGNVLVIVWK
jgi:drug/metabolite transporter (DMT)-like permease